MNTIKILSMIALLMLIQSCSTTKNNVIWVSGIKTECSSGAGKTQCLNVHKGENLDNATWENFYAQIEGFEFEEGIMKKLEIKEQKIENPPADGSSIRYIMVKELEQMIDYRAQINGDWTLNRLNDAPINRSVKIPNMVINLSQKQLSGTGGCNNYTGQITELTANTVNFGKVVNTRRACINKNIEQEYLTALNAVQSYQIKGDNLIFYNAEGDKILSYMKGITREPNQKIHDIWTAVRINGNPIDRMTPTPTMEINLTEMKVFGNDGCNEYTGDIKEATDGQITFGMLASTKKMCRKMETAELFNAAMNQVASYRLEELNLILIDAENKEVLAFLKGD